MNEFAQRYPALVAGRLFDTEDGLRCRIVPGVKKDGDLVLEIESAGQWRRVKFASVALFVEFLYRNEELLYPSSDGHLGGEKVMRFLRETLRVGHEQSSRNLEWEKRNKGVQQGLFADVDGYPIDLESEAS